MHWTRCPLLFVLILSSPWAISFDGAWLPGNTRFALDFSTRYSALPQADTQLNFAGLDLHSVVSGARGDLGTLTLQPYLVHRDPQPGTRDNPELQWRISNFNYTGLAQGRFNVRVGHFELPFGLEQVLDTNGTLHQMNSPAALGLKADWGWSINGTLPQLEYEVARMQGSGDRFSTAGAGYQVGRVATPRSRTLWFGLSYLQGTTGLDRELSPSERFGIDVGWRLPYGFDFFAETSWGETGGTRVSRSLAELRYSTPLEQGLWYLQLRRNRDQGALSRRDHELRLGGRFNLDRRFTLSFDLAQTFGTDEDDHEASLQLRMRL